MFMLKIRFNLRNVVATAICLAGFSVSDVLAQINQGSTGSAEVNSQSFSFSQQLAQLKDGRDCLVYIQGYSYTGQRNNFFSLFFFFPSGIVISTGANTNTLTEEAIEDIVVFSTNSTKGYPILGKTSEYPMGKYELNNAEITFTTASLDGSSKYDYVGVIRSDGSIRYTCSAFENDHKKAVIQYCGAYVNGIFKGNDNFGNIYGGR